jgi:hypothetical protein
MRLILEMGVQIMRAGTWVGKTDNRLLCSTNQLFET